MLDTDTDDIFAILDIEAREDTYSSLLVKLLRRSSGLRRRLLAHALGEIAPSSEPEDIALRRELKDAGVVDILLSGPEGQWTVFIESKLFSAEHGQQTRRYWDACKAIAGQAVVGGVFLTLDGAPASCEHVKPLTHRELTGWIADHRADFQDYPALSVAAEAYIRRAQAPLPEADDQTRIKDLLSPSWGLVPCLAGVAALGSALHRDLAGDWARNAIDIQGPAHSNPGLQFWLPGWWGTEIPANGSWTPENISVHLEMELTPSPPWRLKLHFETDPYLTKKELAGVAGHERFVKMRQSFREAFHASWDRLPGWKMTNYALQIAVLKADVSGDATVQQLRQHIAPALTQVAPYITEALKTAREAV